MISLKLLENGEAVEEGWSFPRFPKTFLGTKPMAKLVQLTIKHGEYEFRSFIICASNQKPDDIAKNFYGDGNGKKDGDGYYFNGGEIYVEVYSVKPITIPVQRMLNKLGIH